jgi:hypothetical protein
MRPARVIAMFVLALASCGKTEQPVFQGAQFNTAGGVMPLYPAESITDQEIADLVAYIGL